MSVDYERSELLNFLNNYMNTNIWKNIRSANVELPTRTGGSFFVRNERCKYARQGALGRMAIDDALSKQRRRAR